MPRGRARIERHGANHSPGGSDPIPGVGSGGSGARKMVAFWAGSLPTIAGTDGLVIRVPYDADGSSFSFTLTRAFARIETSQTAAVVFRLEKSPGGGVFTPTTVDTVTVAAGDYDQEDTGLSAAVSSGDLLRLVYVTVVGTLPVFEVELVGTE
jgi:hypothetical protein